VNGFIAGGETMQLLCKCLLGLSIGLACASGVLAADLDVERLSDTAASRQAAYLKKVEGYAADNFGHGTQQYYAALRQGLVSLGAAHQAEARGASGSFDNVPASLAAPVLGDVEKESGLSKETIEQIEREYAAAKVGARIVGGAVITNQNEFRDTIAFGRAGNLGCSGVVVRADESGTYVLTAAHCVCALGLSTAGADNTKLYVGTNVADPALYVALDFAGQATLYPGAACSGSSSTIRDKDMAMVKFKNNKPAARVQVATIATNDRIKSVVADRNSIYRLVGFGYQRRLNQYGVYQLGEIGQKAYGLIGRGSDCNGMPANLPRDCLKNKEIVLSDSGFRVDTCSGDSGGPVYARNSALIAFRLVAITSRSTSNNGACGPGGVYGTVDNDVVNWMQQTVHVAVTVQD
jgi:hypothetical protein